MSNNSISALEALEPHSVWRLFAGMAAVPRPSGHEEQIRTHIRNLAESLKLKAREDHVGNLVIEAPATSGCERVAPLLLQGHVDMVCEKNSGVNVDFNHDGIKPRVAKTAEGVEIVRADGTTLGADNGIGVCLALAAAIDPQAVHGPLEILCTVDEESGMTGAKNVKPELFRSRRMINLDSEEDDALYIGCAGGADTTLRWNLPLSMPHPAAQAARVSVTGLRGGHSGCDIHQNRGSAIGLLVQTLQSVHEPFLHLASLSGGSKRNAIPREAQAVIAAPKDAIARLMQVAGKVQAESQANGESECRIAVDGCELAAALAPSDTRRILATIAALPHGVLAIVPEFAGLVQTSNGTTTANSQTENTTLRVEIGCLTRSSSKSDMDAVLRKIRAIAELGGAAADQGNEYPGWAPNAKSALLATCARIYEGVFHRQAKVTSIHAGLECGIIGDRVPGMDMVSFGPNIRGAHSPDECVEVGSVQRMYKYLLAVLKELASKGS